jgi:hypothetical protein
MKTLALSMFALAGLTAVAAADKIPTPAARAPATMVAPMPPKNPAPQMPMAQPDEVLVKAGQMMSGTWKCKGNMMNMDGSSTPMAGTNKASVELGKWFIHDSFSAPMGKGKFQFEAYTTYDAGSKTWNRVMVMSDGEWMAGSAKSADMSKQDWDLTMSGPHGAGMFRDHVDATDAKAGVKMWGEASMDKGKTWMKVYEETCKK